MEPAKLTNNDVHNLTIACCQLDKHENSKIALHYIERACMRNDSCAMCAKFFFSSDMQRKEIFGSPHTK